MSEDRPRKKGSGPPDGDDKRQVGEIVPVVMMTVGNVDGNPRKRKSPRRIPGEEEGETLRLPRHARA